MTADHRGVGGKTACQSDVCPLEGSRGLASGFGRAAVGMGKTSQTLKGMYPMDLVTIGEVCLARGEFSKAIAVLKVAATGRRKVSSFVWS